MSKLVLSPSKINTFERCQLQYQYRYLDGMKRPPGVAAAIGIATHKAVEADMRCKMESGQLLPADAIKQAARDSLENTWAGGVMQEPDEPTDKGAAIDQAVALAGLHHNEVAPGIAPIAVEEGFGIKVSDEIELTGHIDVREVPGIRDTKTIGKTPSAIQGDHLTQGQLYSLGVKVNGGAEPTRIKVDYLVKTKTPKALTLEAPVTPDTQQRALDRLSLTARVIKRAIETGDFLPAPAAGWACSEKWCGYWHECPFGAAKKTQG